MFENYDLFKTMIHLRPGGVVEASGPGDRREALAGDAASLWSLGAFHAESDTAVHADHWERHPNGHEVLFVFAGALRVYLRDEGPEPVTTLRAGQSFIVPPGRWHRLAVEEPAGLLSITPRSGTEHERAAA
ncbi:cupin domain-containing protein [Amycolatopsis sp. cmx-8-4]|uniref:cupin domain-containing protein n=1 Tax=Amycolatopsis sp. cmx-8-4 TaxID=2790947 RepID=UPI003979C41C